MQTVTQIISRLKQLTEKLTPRHDAFRHLRLLRTEHKPSTRLDASGWRGLVPRTRSRRKEFAALLKGLD
jgi:hypothetical protein